MFFWCSAQGEDAEWAFCESNYLALPSLRMAAEARVSTPFCLMLLLLESGRLTCLFISPQEQLKQLLITAGFPEGVCLCVFVCVGGG